jgi:hypothetical protein
LSREFFFEKFLENHLTFSKTIYIIIIERTKTKRTGGSKMLRDCVAKKIKDCIEKRENIKKQIDALRRIDPDDLTKKYKLIDYLKRNEDKIWEQQKQLEKKLRFLDGENEEEDLLSQLFNEK